MTGMMLTSAPVMTTFIFEVKNIPAALYKALGGFATNGVNMTKLESYQRGGTFAATEFYADVVGSPADATVGRALTTRLNSLAKRAFRLLGCRDYARVDFRVRPSGKPYILEVNPNPDFCPEAGLCGGLGSAGWTHAELTLQVVRNAVARAQQLAKA